MINERALSIPTGWWPELWRPDSIPLFALIVVVGSGLHMPPLDAVTTTPAERAAGVGAYLTCADTHPE
jgi:hypothetical protein